MEEDGTEPRPGIIAGHGRRKTAKTGEDGGGWYRTPTLVFLAGSRGESKEEKVVF